MAFLKKDKKTEEKKDGEQTTVHVAGEEKKQKISLRMVLTYVLLLAAGLFIGILFSYLSKM